MTFNASKLPRANDKNRKYEHLEPGTYPARLVGIMTLGVQKQRPFKEEEKPPKLEIMLTYELLDEFLKDEEGNELKDKPRFISETLPFFNLKADLAKSTKRYFALDPESQFKGDWSKLLGTPCMVTIVVESDKRPGYDRIYERVASVSYMRPKEASKAPPLVNEPRVFDFYEPNLETFEQLPDWLQEKMKGAVDFAGSPLEALLNTEGGKVPETKKDPVASKNTSLMMPEEEPEYQDVLEEEDAKEKEW